MIGQTLGHYRVLERIGAGGMGVVYRARDERLERDVALKVLTDGALSGETARKRFRKEAISLSRLNHPNIATVHDFDAQSGVQFLVLEYIPGMTLREKLNEGALGEHETVTLGAQMARGLSTAHEHNVIHRDLKPGNIQITPDGRLKILDFGLARWRQAESEATTAEPEGRAVVGTLPYMAPEQIRGERVDERCDIYAAGAVLYEMATGERPFGELHGARLREAILHDEPPPPGSLSHVSSGLANIISKCLDKDPERRYRSARELLVDLERLGAPASPRRPRLALVSVLALALVAILLFLVTGPRDWLGREADHGGFDSVAVLPFENRSANPADTDYLADGISEGLITKLTQLPNVRVVPWMTARSYKSSEKPLGTIAQEMNVRALITGTLRSQGDRLHVTVSLVEAESGLQAWAAEIEESQADLLTMQQRVALGAAERLQGALTADEERTLARPSSTSAEAYEYFLRGKAVGRMTEEANDLAFDLLERALELDPGLAEAHADLGLVQWRRYESGWQGDLRSLEAAEVHFERALDLNPTLASAHGGLILIFHQQGQSEQVLRVGQMAERLGIVDAPTLSTRATAYHYAGLEDKAIPLLRQAIELDPASERAQYELLRDLSYEGRFDEAIAEGAVYLRKFGPRPRAYQYLARSHHSLGDLELAGTYYEKALELDPGDWFNHLYLGVLHRQAGRAEKAREVWSRGAEILTDLLDVYPQHPRAHAMLARFHGYLSQADSLRREETWVLREAPDNGYLLQQLARAHAGLGNPDRAVELFERALRSGCTFLIFPAFMKANGTEYLMESLAFREFLKNYNETLERFRTRY